MDETRFREAQSAYDAGDWRVAAKGFLAAAGNQTVGSGRALHMAGNALMKLRRYGDAVTVYRHGLDDETYDKRGPLLVNMAAALVAQGSYGEAADAYAEAAEDSSYPAKWRAAQGLGGALYEMGRFDEAATAYRQSALDVSNPDPGKALNNLGLAYMGGGRPEEAVEAYKAACEIDGYKGAGKACANLGLALAAIGRHQEAVKAFEKAVHYHGYELAPSARAAFDASRDALTRNAQEIVEGWTTGEMPPVPSVPSVDDATQAMPAVSTVNPDADTDFFTVTDAEMRERDRAVRRAEREASRDTASTIKTLVIVVVGVALLVGLFAAAWYTGLGYPTQSQTVSGLLDAHKQGHDVRSYWVAVPGADVAKEMAAVPPKFKSYEVEQIDRSSTSSKARIVVTLEKGAPLRYSVSLAREGVGWKVNGISNDWRSTGSGQ